MAREPNPAQLPPLDPALIARVRTVLAAAGLPADSPTDEEIAVLARALAGVRLNIRAETGIEAARYFMDLASLMADQLQETLAAIGQPGGINTTLSSVDDPERPWRGRMVLDFEYNPDRLMIDWNPLQQP